MNTETVLMEMIERLKNPKNGDVVCVNAAELVDVIRATYERGVRDGRDN